MSIAVASPIAAARLRPELDPRHGGRRRRRRARPAGALDRGGSRTCSRRLAAQRPRGDRAARARQSRRRRARRRHAGHRRHHGAAAAAGKEARPRRDHGLDAHAPQRRDQLARAVARRRRLHSEAADHARDHDLDVVPPRADRQDPGARHRAASASRRRCRPRAPAHGARRRAGAAAGRQPVARAGHDACRSAQAAAASADAAARAADRLRRPAGRRRSTRVLGAARRRDRPRAGAGHAAHAADLHHHPRRASGARRRPAGARGGRRRAGPRRPDLCRARRPAHAGRAPRRQRR